MPILVSMLRPDHASHTASTAHLDDRVQYLVVGDETSLAALEAELALLPLCARGRVFVEVADASQVVPLPAPLRMTVTWLPRSRRTGRPRTGEGCAPGEAASRAVRAWCAEMLCDGPGATHAIVTGRPTLVADIRDHLTHAVRMPPEALTVLL
jgi:NADPH-dependent ferric siderophore reductase